MKDKSNITDLAEANRMIDDLRVSIGTITSARDELQQKFSDQITANTTLLKEKEELWNMVSTGKKPKIKSDKKSDDEPVDLDELDL